MTSWNATTVSASADLWPADVFFWTTIACRPATAKSHGTRDAFSTGSHAHQPPKLSVSYAQ